MKPFRTTKLRNSSPPATGLSCWHRTGSALSGELVSIDREDLIDIDAGVQVEVNRSEIASRARRAILVRGNHPQTDPVEAVLTWLRLGEISHGPVFRAVDAYGHVAPNRLTTRAVTDIVKTRFCRAGCNPARFSPRSLRSGFVAQTALAGARDLEIMAAAGIRDARSIAEVTKIARRLRYHPARLLGL